MIYSDWRDFLPERGRLRAVGRVLVFTNGCYDLMHPGHLHLLEAARQLGDALIVAINTDASVQANKGPLRPIIPQAERAEVLDGFGFVDYVTFFDAPTPRDIIAGVLPEILVKGADWGDDAIVGREEVEAAGGRVVRINLEPGYSTSAILQAVVEDRPLRVGGPR